MRTSTCFLPKLLLLPMMGLLLATSVGKHSYAQTPVADVGGGSGDVVPTSYSGSGSFFNRKLGTALRFNYRTQGYGTQSGVLSIGGMKVTSLGEGETWFFDGQGTLSDDFGGGFNAGLGYRVLADTGLGFDPQRIFGVGFWTDGQSTNADNFFSQLGFSLESLGDSVDFRLNGSFPLARTQTSDPIQTSISNLSYVGYNLFAGTEDVTIDTALSVIDGEMAKRIHDLEAWAFIGGYQLGGGGIDATGYRVGVRGYAVPDLALSLQVTDDDVYATNVMFGITWFVGRTSRRNQPCGTILDRFREPVLRNNFIATTSRTVSRASGDALTDSETNATMRIVHVDSGAAPGGDGTFEKPYDSIAAANGLGSMENDKILVHSGSTFVGADGSFIAQSGQDILGEGLNSAGDVVLHSVGTVELGLVVLPETSTGSSMEAAPVINGVGDVFTLADNNAVNNFVVNGGTRAVFASDVNSAAAPLLANLDINGLGTDFSGGAIVLTNVTGTTVIENTVTIDDAVGTALFIDGGEDGMSIAAEINNSRGSVMDIQNRTGGTITYTGTVTDTLADGIFSNGILIANNTNATVNLTGTVNLDTGTSNAVEIRNNNGASGGDVGTTITFADLIATATNGNTVDIDHGGVVTFNNANSTASITNTGTGSAVVISGDPVAENNATISIAADITNSVGGRALDIQNRTANNVTVTGNVTGSAEGILLEDNSDGQYSLTGEVEVVATTGNAFTMTNNEGASVSMTDVNLSTTSGNALSVTGGGTLTITDPNGTNTIRAINGGTAVRIVGDDNVGATGDANLAINAAVSSTGTGQSVNISERTSNDVTFNGTVSDMGTGLLVQNNTGGNIIFADTVTANTEADTGIDLDTNVGTTISFNGLDIETTSGIGFRALGGGNLVVTSPVGTNTIETTTGQGLILNGMTIDPGNATFDSVTVNGATNGIVLTSLDGTGQLRIGGGTNAGDGGTLTTTGIAITVNDVDNLLVTNVTVNNTTAAGLNVTGQNGGTATFTGLNVTTTTADAVTVATNTGGTISFNDLTATTGNGDVVTLTNNTGATLSFNGMNLNSTGTGNGFNATGGGTLSASGTNNIATLTGVGLEIDGLTIAGGGAAFSSVSVDGAANGVVLNNLAGGQVTVGSTATASSLANTTGDAIQITNVANVDIINVDVTGAGGNALAITNDNANSMNVSVDDLTVDAASGAGIDAVHTGDGDFTLLVDNSDINSTVDINANGAGDLDLTFDDSFVDTTGNDVAFALTVGTSTDTAAVRIRRNTFSAVDATAFDMQITSAASKTVNFLFDNNIASNSSLDATAEIDASQATILNATITDSFFNNAGAGDDFDIASNSATTVINMQLDNNTANGGAGNFTLRELNASDFNIQERDTVEARNTGTFTFDSLPAGDVTDFDDIISVPLP